MLFIGMQKYGVGGKVFDEDNALLTCPFIDDENEFSIKHMKTNNTQDMMVSRWIFTKSF
jgi:hypothetical protein